ncbi:unnamed protein product [Rotaria sordida]|uniref:Aminotransferase class V domain-containing protein n=1 Tax=Rotaria sordida TaxID=392033 RepID=A0A815BHR4_9BILA|nr:unnamed protein product [Rotaria sordida]
MASLSIDNGLHNKYNDISHTIYSDNNITTCEDKSVVESMTDHLKCSNSFNNPIDSNGIIDLEHFRQLLKPETRLVTTIHNNNEIGSIQSIEELVNLCREYGSFDVIIYSDALQSMGKLPIDVSRFGVDLLANFIIRNGYKQCLSNTLSLTFRGINAEQLINQLSDRLTFSIGSLCHEDNQHQIISRKLQAIGELFFCVELDRCYCEYSN